MDEKDVFLGEKKKILEIENEAKTLNLKIKWQIDDFLQVLRKSRALVAENISDLIKISLKEIANLDLERKSIFFVRDILMKRRKEYPTSYEEDENMVKIAGLTLNEINCIKSRMGEKELINLYLKALKALEEIVSKFGFENQLFNRIYFETIALLIEAEF